MGPQWAHWETHATCSHSYLHNGQSNIFCSEVSDKAGLVSPLSFLKGHMSNKPLLINKTWQPVAKLTPLITSGISSFSAYRQPSTGKWYIWWHHQVQKPYVTSESRQFNKGRAWESNTITFQLKSKKSFKLPLSWAGLIVHDQISQVPCHVDAPQHRAKQDSTLTSDLRAHNK